MMKPQKQLLEHNPSKGIFGDCYRTCVATILGRDPAEVPHVCDAVQNSDICGVNAMRHYLRKEGLTISKSLYNGELSFSAFKKWMHQLNPDAALIVTGQTVRGTVNHCIVMLGGRVFCDPITGEADQDALTGPAIIEGERYWWVEVITKSESCP